MKKNKYFEFKVNKKIVSILTVLFVLVIGSGTVLASHYGELWITDEAPVIKVSSAQWMKGEDYDLFDYVTAFDKEDGDLTSKLELKIYYHPGRGDNGLYEVDLDAFHTHISDDTYYRLVYSVTDSDGNKTTTEVTYYGDQYRSNPLANK